MADITSPLQLGHWQLYERLGEDILLERMLVVPQPGQTPPSFGGSTPAILTRLASPVVGDVTLQSLLRQEAQVLHALRHPGLVSVLERLETPQGPMLVQALPGGVTLSSLVAAAGGRLPMPQVAEVLRQLAELCESLISQARAQGVNPLPAVLYLSPENICIDLYGDVKLLLPGSLLFPLLQQPEWKTRVRSGLCDVPELSLPGGLSTAATQYQLATLAFNLLTGMSLTLEVEALARELSQARTTGQHGLEAARRALPSRLYESLGQSSPGMLNTLSRLLAFEPSQRFANLPEVAETLLREGWSGEVGGDPLEALRAQVAALQQVHAQVEQETSQTMPALGFMPSFLEEPQADPTVTATDHAPPAESTGQLNFSALELGGSLLEEPPALFDKTGPAPMYAEFTGQTGAVPELSQSGTFGLTAELEPDEEAANGPIVGGAASSTFASAATQAPPKKEGRNTPRDGQTRDGQTREGQGAAGEALHTGGAKQAGAEKAAQRKRMMIGAVALITLGLLGLVLLRSNTQVGTAKNGDSGEVNTASTDGQAGVQPSPGQAGVQPSPGAEGAGAEAASGAPETNAGGAEPVGAGGMVSAGATGMGAASGSTGSSEQVPAGPATPLPPLPDEDAPPVAQLQSAGRLPKEILKPFNGRRRPGTIELTLDSSPPDSVLVIDGQDIHRTPIMIEGLSAGEHQLIFRNEEYGLRDVVVIDVRSGEHFSGIWSYQSKKWMPLD
ncbi:MAG: PEGA domain-containing protein [Myxococcota bacterium]